METRYIFRRQDESGPESSAVVRGLERLPGVRILDQGARHVYVSGGDSLAAALPPLSGWTLSEDHRYAVPKPVRPAVRAK